MPELDLVEDTVVLARNDRVSRVTAPRESARHKHSHSEQYACGIEQTRSACSHSPAK